MLFVGVLRPHLQKDPVPWRQEQKISGIPETMVCRILMLM